MAGAEIAQMYIAASPVTSSIARPKKELKGFAKIFLRPRETRRVTVKFDKFTTAFWDEVLHAWVCEKGSYQVLIGSSSAKVRLEGVLEVFETTSWAGL